MKKTGSTFLPLARLLRWLAVAALVAGAVLWVSTTLQVFGMTAGGPAMGYRFPDGSQPGLIGAHPLMFWVAGSLALAATGFGLVRIVQLARLVEFGAVFSPHASHLLASFAAAIFARELIDALTLPAITAILHLADGSTPVTFAHSASQYRVLFITVVFLLISRIMAAAHQLADDNAKII